MGYFGAKGARKDASEILEPMMAVGLPRFVYSKMGFAGLPYDINTGNR
jgi:hypothetical protein